MAEGFGFKFAELNSTKFEFGQTEPKEEKEPKKEEKEPQKEEKELNKDVISPTLKERYEKLIAKLQRNHERLQLGYIRLQKDVKDKNDAISDTARRHSQQLFNLSQQLTHTKMEHEEIQRKVSQLEKDLESEKAGREQAEESWEIINAELKELKEKNKATEDKLATAKTDNEEQDRNIKALEAQIAAQDRAATQHETTIADLRAKLQTANENIEVEKQKNEREIAATAAVTRDNVGVSKQLTDKTTECENLQRERDELQAKEATHEQTEADLEEARDTINALEDQIEKLKADNLRRPFDIQPTAHTVANPTIGETIPTTPTLQEELGIGGSSTSSEAQSEEESDHEDRESSLEPTGEDDTVKLDQAEAGRPPSPVTIIEMKRVFVPYEVSAHSPLLCWIQTELNFLILFSVWLTWVSSQASSFLRRRLPHHRLSALPGDDFQSRGGPKDVPPANDFNVPPPTDVDGPESIPRADDVRPIDDLRIQYKIDQRLSEASATMPPLEEQPDTREVFGEPVRPAPDSPNPVMFPQTGGQAAASAGVCPPGDPAAAMAAALGYYQNRPWYTKIISPLPGDKPSVSRTLSGLIFHLIIYYCIGMGYLCYRERILWLDANDRTRIFLLQLLHNPHGYSSFLHRMTFALPEDWKHGIDVFVFKYFVEKFRLHASIAMPG